MKYIIQLITLIAFVFSVNTALAKGGHNPPPAPEPVNLMNVVTVSEENGDFDSLIDALDSIGDAAEDNQYVIQIGPGVYDIGNAQIIMKPWVLIQGAGRSFTVIRGSRASSADENQAAMVLGADKAALLRMGIENTGAGLLYSIGIRNDNASPVIKHVKVYVVGSVNNVGISNHNNSKPAIENVKVFAGTGVVVDNSSPFILDSVLNGSLPDQYSDGGPGLKLIDSPDSRAVNNMITAGVEVVGVLLSVTPTSASICRGNYNRDLEDVDCPSTP